MQRILDFELNGETSEEHREDGERDENNIEQQGCVLSVSSREKEVAQNQNGAERERQSRVILGEAEMQVANSFAEATKAYADNPTALHLRAMNMLFEGLKERGAMIIVPSSAVDTMHLGSLMGMASLSQAVDKLPTP